MDLATLLTSTVVATIVSGLITGLYSLRAKQRDYMNEYYKVILGRRIAAYEELETLIAWLKTAVIDSDNKPYHMLFSQDDSWKTAYNLIGKISIQTLWLSDDAFRKSQELNYLIFSLNLDRNPIEFGKANYEKIAELRAELEKIVSTDLMNLHDIKRFLREKKNVKHEFHTVNLHR